MNGVSGAAEVSSPPVLLASSALDVESGSLDDVGGVVVVVEVVVLDVVDVFEVVGAGVVGVEVVVLDVVVVGADVEFVEVVVPDVSGGVDSLPHATLSVAQRVKDKDRTMNAFLMVYVDERYPEPLPMQQMAHSVVDVEVAFFRLARRAANRHFVKYETPCDEISTVFCGFSWLSWRVGNCERHLSHAPFCNGTGFKRPIAPRWDL